MPLNAIGWSTEEEEKLAELVQPHSFLYNVLDPSRKNILAREATWLIIAQELSKPVEEVKKRWRGLRDSYMRGRRQGTNHKISKVGVFEKLYYLDDIMGEETQTVVENEPHMSEDDLVKNEEQIVTDATNYITVVDSSQQEVGHQFITMSNIDPDTQIMDSKKITRKSRAGRKRYVPMPNNVPPIKILPKPIYVNSPKLVKYVEDPKLPEQRSQTIDKLIEKMLKENTNEIDIFFRSMAASVKKLQPNLIPKVKTEVCNVIAKYEMQSFNGKHIN